MARKKKRRNARRSTTRRTRRHARRGGARRGARRGSHARRARRGGRKIGCKRVRVKIGRKTFWAHKGPKCPKRKRPHLHRGMSVWKAAAKSCGRQRGTGRVGSRKFVACMRKYVHAHGG